MYQIRVHGRGGQGVVTAAELIAIAAIYDGRYAQAFPSFGSERTGAPVEAYCRIDDAPIRSHEPVDSPDTVLVLDATLLGRPGLFQGLRPYGLVLVNSPGEVRNPAALNLRTVPATRLALERTGRPLPNAPMLGAFAAASGAVGIEAVRAAISLRFPGKLAKANVRGADDAYAYMQQDEAAVLDLPTALVIAGETEHVN